MALILLDSIALFQSTVEEYGEDFRMAAGDFQASRGVTYSMCACFFVVRFAANSEFLFLVLVDLCDLLIINNESIYPAFSLAQQFHRSTRRSAVF